VFACFGGFTWAGAAVKKLTEFAERVGWTMVAPPIEIKQGCSPEKAAPCAALADAIVSAM
jgi:flavorubredoxin